MSRPWLSFLLIAVLLQVQQADAQQHMAKSRALVLHDTTIEGSGRKLLINKDGLPAHVQSLFTADGSVIGTVPHNIFTEPLHFHFYDSSGKQPLQWKNSGVQIMTKKNGDIAWQAINTSKTLAMMVSAVMNGQGAVKYTVVFKALENTAFKEINFHLPFEPAYATSIQWLGEKKTSRPDSVLWKWNVNGKQLPTLWIGNANAGTWFTLRDERVTHGKQANRKAAPCYTAWCNNNKGGIEIFQKGKSILVNAYSGDRTMKKGDMLYYNFNLMITPEQPGNTTEIK